MAANTLEHCGPRIVGGGGHHVGMESDRRDIDPDDPCPFCLGINAAIDGHSLEDNPYPAPPPRDDPDWAEADHVHWAFGFRSEQIDPKDFRKPTAAERRRMSKAIRSGKVRFTRNALRHIETDDV